MRLMVVTKMNDVADDDGDDDSDNADCAVVMTMMAMVVARVWSVKYNWSHWRWNMYCAQELGRENVQKAERQ